MLCWQWLSRKRGGREEYHNVLIVITCGGGAPYPKKLKLCVLIVLSIMTLLQECTTENVLTEDR